MVLRGFVLLSLLCYVRVERVIERQVEIGLKMRILLLLLWPLLDLAQGRRPLFRQFLLNLIDAFISREQKLLLRIRTDRVAVADRHRCVRLTWPG